MGIVKRDEQGENVINGRGNETQKFGKDRQERMNYCWTTSHSRRREERKKCSDRYRHELSQKKKRTELNARGGI